MRSRLLTFQMSCLMLQQIKVLPLPTSARTSWPPYLLGIRAYAHILSTLTYNFMAKKFSILTMNASQTNYNYVVCADWWSFKLHCQKSIWVSTDWPAFLLTSASYCSWYTSTLGTQTRAQINTHRLTVYIQLKTAPYTSVQSSIYNILTCRAVHFCLI